MLACVCALSVAAAARGDIDPVTLTVSAPARVTAGKKATIKVTVAASSEAFSIASAPIRARARLAKECGGDYEGTTGRTVLDARLTTQPSTSSSFSGVATSRPKLTKTGAYHLCVFVTDADGRQYASDVDSTITVRKKPKKH